MDTTAPGVSPRAALAALWHEAALPPAALDALDLTGGDPVLPSSFRLATAAMASIGAAALAAAEFSGLRGWPRPRVALDAADAALECTGWFSLDGVVPPAWDPVSGLYRCADGWLRLHANFVHHRDAALHVLGLPADASRDAVGAGCASRGAFELEDAVAAAGGVAAALRRFDDWDAQPQSAALRGTPVVAISRLGDAAARQRPPLRPEAMPLAGLRVLDLTRILAGPVAGRALAAWGADVLLVNSPRLPNIAAIADTSRGKRSAWVDLQTPSGIETLRALVREADVFLQGYRPGALARLGFGPAELAALRPGIVSVSLSAWGARGPWAARRGFDSLVQAATGFNLAEAEAAGAPTPRALPCQMIDFASGYLLAFGALAALCRQQQQGGSWQVEVSLARTGEWLRLLGRVDGGFALEPPERAPRLVEEDSGFGRLQALRHPVRFDGVPVRPGRPSMPPGSHPAAWEEGA